MTGRFRKVEGLNYKRGAFEYPDQLAPSDRHHLYTKPFYNLAHKVERWTGDGLDEDTQRHFCDFANIAYALALTAGATILDIGCGSGWLSEYFARLGYKVTGLDLSPELVRIARERIAAVAFGLDDQRNLDCSFVVHDIEEAPLPEKFAAIVCYDSLHHFENENAVLSNIAQMLEYGGLLFIAEGEQPEPGSQSEAELVAVMEQYQTLEAPFDRAYLIQLLERHGFTVVGDYISVPGFIDRDNVVGNTIQFVEPLAFNYLLCKKLEDDPTNVPDSRNPGVLRANFTVENRWRDEFPPGSEIEVMLGIENTGDTVWLVSRTPLHGHIRLALKILDEVGNVVEEVHGSPRLQRAMAPGEKTSVKIISKSPSVKGKYSLKIDLIDQNICWFEQRESVPVILPFTVT